MDASGGEREIDGATRSRADATHIGTALENLNAKAAFDQTQPEERTVQSRANEGDGLGFRDHLAAMRRGDCKLFRQQCSCFPQFGKEFLVEGEFQVRRTCAATGPHAHADGALDHLDVAEAPADEQSVEFGETLAYVDPIAMAALVPIKRENGASPRVESFLFGGAIFDVEFAHGLQSGKENIAQGGFAEPALEER